VFIQIIQGRCSRPDEVRALAEEWSRDMAPGATGWLGGTYGITDEGEFLGVVRFEDREAAMANSARHEQGEWARRMEALMDGPVEYHDCDDVTLMMDGGSDDAGFVQVIRGRIEDPDRLKAMMTDTDELHRLRPEIIGGTLAIEDDGTFTETIAFTDEASARAGEQREYPEMPAEMRDTFEKVMTTATYYDLHHPWFHSAR
jgi:hypothetical protein